MTKPKETIVDKAMAAGKAAVAAIGDALVGDTAAIAEMNDGAEDHVANAHEFADHANAHLKAVTHEANVADYERAQLGQVENYSALPENASLQLRFADGNGFIDGEVPVGRDALTPDGAKAFYARDVEFDLHIPPAAITEAWLIASTGDACKCAVGVVALPVGGGHSARIPANSLLF